MANWSNPLLTSTYVNFVTEVKDRDVDLALQFDGTTSTNIPTGTIRWNSSANRWQKWNGSSWGELTSTYALTGLSTTGNASIGGTLSVTGTTSLAGATASTPATSDNSTAVATTAYVRAQNYALLTSPAFTGTPTAPTAAIGTNSTQLATCAYVNSEIANDALLLSGGTLSGSLTASALIPSGSSVPARGLYLPAANTVALATNGTGRLFVNASGNVGIGTSTPQNRLEVIGDGERMVCRNATNSGIARIEAQVQDYASGSSFIGTAIVQNGSTASGTTAGLSNGNLGILQFQNTSAGVVVTNGETPLVFATASTERMRIDGSGRVGINNTAPGTILDVGDPGTGLRFLNGAGGNLNIGLLGGTSSVNSYIYQRANGPLIFGTNNAERLRIDSSGRLLVGTSASRPVADANVARVQIDITDYVAFSATQNSNDEAGPVLCLGKSRGSSTGSNTLVSSGDTLGRISFGGADGTDLASVAASIETQVDGTPGANDMPGRLVFSTTADAASSPTERLRIDSSGKVGIGTTSPGEKLHVLTGANKDVRIANASHNTLTTGLSSAITFSRATDGVGNISALFGWNNGGIVLAAREEIVFANGGASTYTETVERLRIDSSGRVGIGTSTPQNRLEVIGDGERMVCRNATNSGIARIEAQVQDYASGSSFIGTSIVQNGSTTAGTNAGLSNANLGILNFQNTSAGLVTTNGAVPLVFATASTERMRISSAGAVTLGGMPTTSRTSASGALTAKKIGLYDPLSIPEIGWYGDSPTPALKFLAWWHDSTNRLNITDADSLQGVYLSQDSNAWAGYSDARLKQNITPIIKAIETVKDLKPCNYVWKSSQINDVGFVAQETKVVFPLAVDGNEADFSVDEETGRVYGAMGIKMDKIVPLLTAALQEAIAKIETLEAKVAALEEN